MGKSNQTIDLASELNAGGFGKQETLDGSMLMLNIDNIETYDRNPRKSKNPKYEEIKAAIQAQGMKEVLSVTQRPGTTSQVYMCARGGNTTLQICKELFAETQDERFQIISCRYVAWSKESTTLIDTIVENEARGDIRFIDKARSTLEAKALLEEEEDTELSNYAFLKLLKAQGHKVSIRNLRRYIYIIEELYPYIPQVFDSGAGGSECDKIQKLHNAAINVYQAHTGEGGDAFNQLFGGLLSEFNDEKVDYEALTQDICYEIAGGDATEANQIAWKLDAVLKGDDDFNREYETLGLAEESKEESLDDLQGASNEMGGISPSVVKQTKRNTKKPADSKANRLKTNRAKMYALAATLSEHMGFGDLISPLSYVGTGYLVTEIIVVERLFPNLSNEDRPKIYQACSVWWLLLSYSEQVSQFEYAEKHFPEGFLKQCLSNNDLDAIHQRVPDVSRSPQMFRFIDAELEDREFDLCVELRQCYREIISDLWEPWKGGQS